VNDTAEPTDADRVDLFVSHAGRDRAWAEWVAWELQHAGYRVELDYWDWEVGENFVEKMRDALDRADRMVALFSEAYFEAERYTTVEWTALLTDRDAVRPRLLPFRIENVTPPKILRPLLSGDLFGVLEAEARRLLLEAVGGRKRPDRAPGFPEDSALSAGGEGRGPRLPGWLPGVWNLPLRNVAFTGRDGMIVALRDRLCAGRHVVVEALHGMGGVGKTQLAIEYGHRFAGDYDLGWWIDSEQPELVGKQMTGLAVALKLVEADAGTPTALAAVKSYLGQHDRWLLIFDNADGPAAVRQWLPSGPGHVLITSRHHVWSGVAEPLPVDVFARAESIALLRRQLPTLTNADADRLAGELDDLPLAVAQAAVLLAETGMPVTDYLRELAERTAQITAEGTPTDYPVSLAAAVRLSSTRLEEEDPAAGQLLELLAFLAPGPVPLELFSGAPDGLLPEPLGATVRTPLAFRRSVGRIVRYGLARLRNERPILHRLMQAILRNDLTPLDQQTSRTLVERLLIAARPDDGTTPALWPRWAQLLPQVVQIRWKEADSPDLFGLGVATVNYLFEHGEINEAHGLAIRIYEACSYQLGIRDEHALRAAVQIQRALKDRPASQDELKFASDVYSRCSEVFGENHPDTLESACYFASGLNSVGRFEEAFALDKETLPRRQRVLGVDHSDTLRSATNFASSLHEMGRHDESRALYFETLERCERSLGSEHPCTLLARANASVLYYRSWDYFEARLMDEETLTRCRAVLGDDHPTTLIAAFQLGSSLFALGQFVRSRRVNEETWERRWRILGEKHPDTLRSANSFALSLFQAREFTNALEIDKRTLSDFDEVLGQCNLDVVYSICNLATSYYASKQYELAEDLDIRALAAVRKLQGAGHIDTLRLSSNLALTLRKLGRGKAASGLANSALLALRDKCPIAEAELSSVMRRRAGELGQVWPSRRVRWTRIAAREQAMSTQNGPLC
jgi:tetratricopeptide (TPR) repeat protein